MPRPGTHDPTAAYRHEARQLRHRYARRPGQLYRSLRDLSDRQDGIWNHNREQPDRIADRAGVRNGVPSAQKPRCSAETMNQFATLVAAELQSGLLPYSRRAELLRWAQSRKVNRFDANLVIASVQHQMGQLSVERIEFQPSRGRLTGLFWIGVMQTILAIAVWALFIR